MSFAIVIRLTLVGACFDVADGWLQRRCAQNRRFAINICLILLSALLRSPSPPFLSIFTASVFTASAYDKTRNDAMAFISLRFLALSLPVSTLISTVFAQCYYPDGETLAPDVACNSSASVSSCCGSGSWCLDNGLCYDSGVVSRGSCTDKSWGEGCAQYCQTGRFQPSYTPHTGC